MPFPVDSYAVTSTYSCFLSLLLLFVFPASPTRLFLQSVWMGEQSPGDSCSGRMSVPCGRQTPLFGTAVIATPATIALETCKFGLAAPSVYRNDGGVCKMNSSGPCRAMQCRHA